jgi:hypothetical protein
MCDRSIDPPLNLSSFLGEGQLTGECEPQRTRLAPETLSPHLRQRQLQITADDRVAGDVKKSDAARPMHAVRTGACAWSNIRRLCEGNGG